VKQAPTKNYTDPRARQVYSIARLVDQGSEPTGELIEACRDLSCAMSRWARRAGFHAVAEDTTVNTPPEPQRA